MRLTHLAFLAVLCTTAAAQAQPDADPAEHTGSALASNEQAPVASDSDALVAFESYRTALETPAATQREVGDAIRGISAVQARLVNIGTANFEAQQYEKAFLSFQASLRAHDILTTRNQTSALADPGQHDQIVQATALSARLAGRNADALKYHTDLYSKGNATADIYDGLYALRLNSGDEAGAMKALQEGRARYPGDTALLFTEINAFLKKGQLIELTDRLKRAIETEPANIGLYVTLGNVYDNLYQTASTQSNAAKAAEYFDEALKYYTQAAARDPRNLDATYSLGSLYYNKAALRTQTLTALAEDYSKEGMKRYDAGKAEVMGLFDQALPYFQKAESIDANDVNTLIALKEIYARKEDTLSSEFKSRLEVVQGGGKNATSYFNK